MLRIAIIVGSTRPSRRTVVAAGWVAEVAARHAAGLERGVRFEVVDLAEQHLPLLDEEMPALFGEYAQDHTLRWARTVAGFDGFVFVTPEYNRSMPAALKNAIDYLHTEWNHKAAGFVSHGIHGGTHAVAHLRQTLAEVKVAGVGTHVALSAFHDFALESPTDPGVVTPGEHQEPTLTEMLDEVIAWSEALRQVRDSGRFLIPA